MSQSHLCHRFREFFGSSIREYVVRKRMSAAQGMLYKSQTKMSSSGKADVYRRANVVRTGQNSDHYWLKVFYPILIRSSAAATSATRNRTALPSLKYGIRPDNRLQPMTLLPTFIYPPI